MCFCVLVCVCCVVLKGLIDFIVFKCLHVLVSFCVLVLLNNNTYKTYVLACFYVFYGAFPWGSVVFLLLLFVFVLTNTTKTHKREKVCLCMFFFMCYEPFCVCLCFVLWVRFCVILFCVLLVNTHCVCAFLCVSFFVFF